jgi:CRISPR/Cas system-associated exonuclease Cas4 (RecB family)
MTAKEVLEVIEEDMSSRAENQTPAIRRDESGRLCIRASSLGKCKRALWYQLHGEKGLPNSLESIHAFDHGKQAHEAIRQILRNKFDLEEEKEVIYEDWQLRITGHVDGVLDVYILEIKSTKNFGFEEMKRGKIGSEYLAQLHAYMAAEKKEKAILIVDNKPQRTVPAIVSFLGYGNDDLSGVIAVIEVPFDRQFWTELLESLDCLEEAEPPISLPSELDDQNVTVFPWQCAYCEFAHVCRKGARLITKRKVNGSYRHVYGYQAGSPVRLGILKPAIENPAA